MNKNNVRISYIIRKLIQDKSVQRMVSDLYRNRKSKDAVFVILPLANERFNEIAGDPFHEGMEDFDEYCRHLNDTLLLNELIKLNVLSISKGECVDDEDFSACVKISNPEFIEHIYRWIKDEKLILNYGIFSLHTFTGEAYCLDNKYTFHTNKGLFHVLKAFLNSETHTLDYKTIYIFSRKGERQTLLKKMTPVRINEIIGDIREKLGMKKKLSKLFIPSSNQYFLQSGIDR